MTAELREFTNASHAKAKESNQALAIRVSNSAAHETLALLAWRASTIRGRNPCPQSTTTYRRRDEVLRRALATASRPQQHSRVAPTVRQLVRQASAVSIERRHNRPALELATAACRL